MELDEKEFTSLRLCCCELRNHYVSEPINAAVLLDLGRVRLTVFRNRNKSDKL